ncbi:MAG TPA: polyprenol monophosphomannose synthase [Bacteroidia bacterium]|nr:polyprenol monophosphomannose synthase [Bacteroidia bacterium]
MSDSIVIIPTYNEKENIELMIRKVFSLPKAFHLLIVDDNSPDGTRDIVKRILPEFEGRLHLLERGGKEGLGRAYIAGFKWCLQHRYEYIFEMDADFSHNPDDLVKLYETAANGADLVVGSRYKSGINVVNWPMSRVLMSYYASWYVRFITGMTVSDTTAGFVCYRRKVLETIELDKIKFKGYAFQIEMKHTAWKIGFKIDEVSIIFTDRTMGQSKMSKGIFKEAIWGVIELRLKSFFRRYPKIA